MQLSGTGKEQLIRCKGREEHSGQREQLVPVSCGEKKYAALQETRKSTGMKYNKGTENKGDL